MLDPNKHRATSRVGAECLFSLWNSVLHVLPHWLLVGKQTVIYIACVKYTGNCPQHKLTCINHEFILLLTIQIGSRLFGQAEVDI